MAARDDVDGDITPLSAFHDVSPRATRIRVPQARLRVRAASGACRRGLASDRRGK